MYRVSALSYSLHAAAANGNSFACMLRGRGNGRRGRRTAGGGRGEARHAEIPLESDLVCLIARPFARHQSSLLQSTRVGFSDIHSTIYSNLRIQ